MRALAHRHDLVLSVDDFGRSFERHLHAARKSPRTVKTYMEAVQLLSAFLEQQDGGRTLLEARRADIEAFLVHLHERCTPATVANRYRSLRRFYGWLEEEEEIPVFAMAKMKPPAVPEQSVPVLAGRRGAAPSTCSSACSARQGRRRPGAGPAGRRSRPGR